MTRDQRKTARVPTRNEKDAVQFSELLESKGTTKNDIEKDNAGARIIEG